MRDRDLVRVRRMSQTETGVLHCILWAMVGGVFAGWLYMMTGAG